MNVSEQYKIETAKIAAIIAKIDNMDTDYFNVITDEINQYQPFLLSILLGYRFDFKAEEVGEFIKIYLICCFTDKFYFVLTGLPFNKQFACYKYLVLRDSPVRDERSVER